MTFDDFWTLYPKKVAKGAARKAYAKIPVTSHDDIQEDLEVRAQHRLWPEYQFIPYPATYLNQERWEDEMPPEAQGMLEQWTDRSWSGELPDNVKRLERK